MKGIRLILAVCLAATCFFGARADNDGDAVRAAARRGAQNLTSPTTQSRQKSVANSTVTNTQSTRDTANVANRAVATGGNATTTTQTRSAVANVSAREGITTQSRGATGGNVVSRTGATIQSRTTPTTHTATRTGATVQSRATPTARATTSAAHQSRAATGVITRAVSGAISAPHRTVTNSAANKSRAATTDTVTTTATAGNYKECRTVYYECMDEFCANKDSQLRRCACSSRTSEFDGLKEQMTKVEDKLLDFNQRLLTVNMDKEDALAINTATEGELAFNQADKSDSKKALDEISKKLNSTFKNSSLDNGLSAINLSLDMDSAFDNLDSMMGASTVTKNGTQLYSAALPVCREMAAEVCSDDELSIAESGYQMMIEQDCNTVAKAYSSQAETAREKIREGGALLDMSRLNTHQTRNSDDILTCKSKMLEMLSDSTVCGDNLGKCLDTSGEYIDPSTGEAFLSEHLSQLATLLTRPTGDQKWTTVPGNEKFVTFLNSKKKFLAPAMENCQDIADTVWDEFIEDALAQIKLAQNAKLEDMRQSCTQLVTQCMTDTAKSISDFDSRALSIFGVMADKTVREMCSQVQTACTALLDKTGGGGDWTEGINQIATDKTYETLLYTCREVGKNCIIQACKSTSGNFGLCMNPMSANRKSIVGRHACWNEVKECIANADQTTLAEIMTSLETAGIYSQTNGFYESLYADTSTIERICDDKCSKTYSLKGASPDCIKCRLAERVWGNCQQPPPTPLKKESDTNKILLTKDSTETDTLLAWFASNTNTTQTPDSCLDAECGAGQGLASDGACYPNANISSNNQPCTVPFTVYSGSSPDNTITSCCPGSDNIFVTGKDDAVTALNIDSGAACGNNYVNKGYGFFNVKNAGSGFTYDTKTASMESIKNEGGEKSVFLPGRTAYQVAGFKGDDNKIYYLVCVGSGTTAPTYCNGEFFIVRDDGLVFSPSDVGTIVTSSGRTPVTNFYHPVEGTECAAKVYKNGNGNITGSKWEGNTTCPEAKRWSVRYGNAE